MAQELRPRDHAVERQATELAARAAGLTRRHGLRMVGNTAGLDDFADHRALPGGVRADIDADREALEEIADLRNYIVWKVEPLWQGYLDGEPEASKVVAQRLRALALVIQAWHVLLEP